MRKQKKQKNKKQWKGFRGKFNSRLNKVARNS